MRRGANASSSIRYGSSRIALSSVPPERGLEHDALHGLGHEATPGSGDAVHVEDEVAERVQHRHPGHRVDSLDPVRVAAGHKVRAGRDQAAGDRPLHGLGDVGVLRPPVRNHHDDVGAALG